jgi:DNA-binding GntR family transcriptional regulator
MESVIEAGLRVRDQLVHSNESWRDSVPEHQAIVDAVTAGDAEGSAAAVRRLLTRSSQDAAQTMDQTDRPVRKRRPRNVRAGTELGAEP